MPPSLKEGEEGSWHVEEGGGERKMDGECASWAFSCDSGEHATSSGAPSPESFVHAADHSSARIRTVVQALGASPLTEDLREHVQRAVELSHAQRAATSASLSALNFSYLMDIDRESGRARVRFDLDTDAQVRNRDMHMGAVFHMATPTHPHTHPHPHTHTCIHRHMRTRMLTYPHLVYLQIVYYTWCTMCSYMCTIMSRSLIRYVSLSSS